MKFAMAVIISLFSTVVLAEECSVPFGAESKYTVGLDKTQNMKVCVPPHVAMMAGGALIPEGDAECVRYSQVLKRPVGFRLRDGSLRCVEKDDADVAIRLMPIE